MPRSGDAARRRLQDAALELYREHGFDATTTAEIAERAGVTERTFFRHFADKREVFFDREPLLRTTLTAAIAEEPDGGLASLRVLRNAFTAVVPILEENRALAEARAPVIAATPALRERELAKVEALTHAMADALRARGVAEGPALLAAQVGMAAFSHATRQWRIDPRGNLPDLIAQSFDDVTTLGSVLGRGSS